MKFALFSAAVGFLAGLAGGGRLSALGRSGLAHGSIGVLGLVTMTLAVRAPVPNPLIWLIGAYGVMLIFVVFNARRFVGMWLIGVGLTLNATVLIVNDGTPYRLLALVDAGVIDAEAAVTTNIGAASFGMSSFDTALSHVEHPGDRLVVLGDVIPVRPLRETLSVGDILLAFGLGGVIHTAMTRTTQRGGAQSRRAKHRAPRSSNHRVRRELRT